MTFDSLFNSLVEDTVSLSVPSFAPELTICVTIVVMLLARLVDLDRLVNVAWIAMAGSLVALYLAAPQNALHLSGEAADANLGSEIFTGLLVYDSLTVFFRSLLLIFAVLFIAFTQISGIPDREDGADFYSLVLGATLGMCLMASANHLLMVFLAVEMASVPSYVLAGILKGRRKSSEAAIKYAVYGAGAAGVMLYGISLLVGVLGTAHLPSVALELGHVLSDGDAFGDRQMVLALGGLMVMVGLAFKLSAVPFHFWCPDVFEGACAEVNAFLSVASKAAALGLLVRVGLGIGYVPERVVAEEPVAVTAASEADLAARDGVPVTAVSFDGEAADAAATSLVRAEIEATNDALAPARTYMVMLVSLLAAVTCTFGNLAAYGQTNIKRLMAYSTIAHAGYLMMPVAAAIQLVGHDAAAGEVAVASMAFYIAVYLFMNLAAFAVIAFLRNAMGSEEIKDYAGLLRECPGLTICFSLVLISLLGLPPLAGFAAKFYIFGSLVEAELWALLAIGGLNTAISLFYYLRVIRVMTMEPAPEGRVPVRLPLASSGGAYVLVVSLPVVILGILWGDLHVWTLNAVMDLLT